MHVPVFINSSHVKHKEGHKMGMIALAHSLSKYIRDEDDLVAEIRSNSEYADFTAEEIKVIIAQSVQK